MRISRRCSSPNHMLASLLFLLSMGIRVRAQSKVTIVLTSTQTPSAITLTQSVLVMTDTVTTVTSTIQDSTTIDSTINPETSTSFPQTVTVSTTLAPTFIESSRTTLSIVVATPTSTAAGSATPVSTLGPNHTTQVVGGVVGATAGAFLAILILVIWGCRHHKKVEATKLLHQTPTTGFQNTPLPTAPEPPLVGTWTAPPPPGSSLWHKVTAASFVSSAPPSARVPTPPLPTRSPARASSAGYHEPRNRYSIADSDKFSILSETIELAPWRQPPTNQEGNRGLSRNLTNGNGSTAAGQPNHNIERRDDSNPPSVQYGTDTVDTRRNKAQNQNLTSQSINPSRNSIAASSIDWTDNTSIYTTDWTSSGQLDLGSPERSQSNRSPPHAEKFLRYASPASTNSPATTILFWPDDDEPTFKQTHNKETLNQSGKEQNNTSQYGRRPWGT